MTLKNYLILMGTATAVVWGMFAFIITGVDPESASWLGFLLFYISLFLAIAGSTAILGLLIPRFQDTVCVVIPGM